ncbi:hypothetical protein MKX03_008840 [Papaver bracteatum]|nr:hypothetical protein MKX03_008840 [Papaver bracteatum]
MAAALSWTCGIEPDNYRLNASYAFNLYYQKKNRITGSCDFNGTAMITTTNTSHGTCVFPDHYQGFTRSSASRLQYGVTLATVVIVVFLFY